MDLEELHMDLVEGMLTEVDMGLEGNLVDKHLVDYTAMGDILLKMGDTQSNLEGTKDIEAEEDSLMEDMMLVEVLHMEDEPEELGCLYMEVLVCLYTAVLMGPDSLLLYY